MKTRKIIFKFSGSVSEKLYQDIMIGGIKKSKVCQSVDIYNVIEKKTFRIKLNLIECKFAERWERTS